MLLLTAILAALSVSARNPINGIDHYPGPDQPISNQCAAECKAETGHRQPKVCPVSINSFQYLCGEYNYLEAQEACAKKGWRLAVLTEENRRDAYDTMAQCLLIGGEAAWISNYLGQDGDPCAILLRSGGVLLGLGQQACSKRRLGAVCEPVPVITLTTSATVSTTLFTGTSTVTSTVTKCHQKPAYRHHNRYNRPRCSWHCDKAADPKCVPCEKDAHLEAGDEEKNCPYGNCSRVCPFKRGDIRIVQKNVTPDNAANECQKYGWTLLDLTVGRMNDLAIVAEQCSYGDENLWINSFNGVDSPCLNTFGAKYSNVVPVGYPVIDEWCTLDNQFYVACQKGPQAETGKGPYHGLIGKTVTTDISSAVFTLPSATVTVTRTVWKKDSSSSSSSSSSDSDSDSWRSWCSEYPTDPSCSSSSSSDWHHYHPRGRHPHQH